MGTWAVTLNKLSSSIYLAFSRTPKGLLNGATGREYRLVANAELPICQRVSFAGGDRQNDLFFLFISLSSPVNDTRWQIGNLASATSL
jgi:hypothetical protein